MRARASIDYACVLLESCLFAPHSPVWLVCSVVRGNRAADAGIKMGEHVIDINGEYVKDKTVFERSVRGPALKHALYILFSLYMVGGCIRMWGTT